MATDYIKGYYEGLKEGMRRAAWLSTPVTPSSVWMVGDPSNAAGSKKPCTLDAAIKALNKKFEREWGLNVYDRVHPNDPKSEAGSGNVSPGA